MTYQGPERRDDSLIILLETVVESQVRPVVAELGRLSRLIEGENNAGINSGIIGSIHGLTDTDAKLDIRVGSLERRWDRFKWTITGAALGGGLAGGGIGALIVDIVRTVE